MPATRVFLMGMPTMLRDVVRALVAGDPAFELAGEAVAVDDGALLAARADVVVAGSDVLDDVAAEGLLRRECGLRVIGFATDGASATLFEMRPHREPLGELGVHTLRSVLRGVGTGR